VVSYQRALALKPGMAEGHGNLGNALLAQNKLDEAETSYSQALRSSRIMQRPGYQPGQLAPGQAEQEKLGKLDEAVACYQRAIELKPATRRGALQPGQHAPHAGQIGRIGGQL